VQTAETGRTAPGNLQTIAFFFVDKVHFPSGLLI
jgi:hypothetical protein